MKTIKYTFAAVMLLLINVAKADTNTPISKVLSAYLEVKNALANDDSKLANQKAVAFTTVLKQVGTDKMGAKQKAAWLKYYEKLRFDGENIGESTAIAHQREHFASLSKSMYAVLKLFKTNSGPVYVQYCPMKKASWLSESKTIENPYYGKSMGDCGKVTETIAASAN